MADIRDFLPRAGAFDREAELSRFPGEAERGRDTTEPIVRREAGTHAL